MGRLRTYSAIIRVGGKLKMDSVNELVEITRHAMVDWAGAVDFGADRNISEKAERNQESLRCR